MGKKTILVLYDKIPEINNYYYNDINNELSTVSSTIKKLGYNVINIEMVENITSLVSKIVKINPYIVFNLVKSAHNQYGYIQILLSMLEYEGIPLTGANENVFFSSGNIYYFKNLMDLSHINTPKWQTLKNIKEQGICLELPFILKCIYKGKDKGFPGNVVCNSETEFYDIYKKLDHITCSRYFIESYIKGQKLTIGLLGSAHDPEFFTDGDLNMLYEINKISLTCWKNYLFNGYVIVHFRLDNSQKPWIVDLTVNPSLSPDSVFVKSALRKGYTYEGLIIKIIDESVLYKNSRCARK